MENSEIEHLSGRIRNARLAKKLTKKELARRYRTNIDCIHLAEKSVLNVSWATLRKIIESGLGGELKLAIKL